ncbi:MAG: NAD-glutamate dehydrogenase [Acetobacteraceae bacterium]
MAADDPEHTAVAPHQVPGMTSSEFIEVLFHRSAREDLARYRPADLEALAAAALAHVAAAGSSRPDIRLADHECIVEGRTEEITVLEVVNDNMPFLLDSTLGELTDQGFEPQLVAHPILAVERDRDGALIRLEGDAAAVVQPGLARASLIHVHLGRIDDPAERTRLVAGLRETYAAVALAVEDWAGMWARVDEVVRAYRTSPPPLAEDELAEAVAFLLWLRNDNFVFLGVREYRLPDGDVAADPVPGSGLGLLRDPAVKVLRRGRELVVMTPEIRAFLARPQALIIAKANVKSRVHRRAYLDYVGVKLFSASGRLEGELRLVGLFTASAYTSTTGAVPYLRHKVAKVVARANFDPASYAGRALFAVLEDYPRDELFQIDEETLYRFAMAIMNLSERPRIRALIRPDEFDRFISILVFLPKDRYDTQVRQRIGAWLAELYRGRVSAAYPAYPEGPLARTHFIIGYDEGERPPITQAALEAGIATIARTWRDALRDALIAAEGGARARTLVRRYADAFSAAYREAFPAERALADIAILERLSQDRPRAARFDRVSGAPASRAAVLLFSREAALPLSERVPILENLGFRVLEERTFRIDVAGSVGTQPVWLHDMEIERASGAALDLAVLEPKLEAALLAVLHGVAESDGYNRLVLEAGLDWREASLLRGLGRYLQQIGTPYAQDYLAATLARHHAITARLMVLFYARFDPAVSERDRGKRQGEIRAAIEAALADVAILDDDRILRRFANLIEAAVRTNYFQRGADGRLREAIACKFDCHRIEALPEPRPLFEIFVYSPRVEALHMRMGRVARGGIRWTDRPQDFRTEILGLCKAQQVKNAVIVQVGAKGGFFPKHLPSPADRQDWLAEGIASYRIFIDALLQLTDDIGADGVIPPPETVRHDPDDPYLVVAADKGTATFSDIANELAIAHNYWLGDAFASGGSNGYDHKRMGITARGAFESVKRHFRAIDIDIESQTVPVVGVGDMSGDVFGNGMLLSRTLKLIAAFDHRDIFLDPDPDPATAWTERRRLFDLPRSSWADYNPLLISKGGGVYSCSLKSVPLSPEAQTALGLRRNAASPADVMNAILKAPVDFIWFGGIGTYVRASTETDAEAGDRANDAIRIAATELHARVIGEGANLGVTQRGRIEAAQHGILLNTDAIDNSAGVNTSDVEVNIKIALAVPRGDGRLDDASRHALLAEMTEDVAQLVLRNNYLQPLALSLADPRNASDAGLGERLMQVLEQEGRLSRAVEFLPDTATLAERYRRGDGLTRPEVAVLLAYAKLALHDHVLESSLPDDPYLARELTRYFPEMLNARFPDAIAQHRLRREIIATGLANAIVNRCGPAVVPRLADETGADTATIAAAYVATRDCFDLSALNAAIDQLDARLSGALQLELYHALQDLLLDRMVWFVRNISLTAGHLDQIVARYRSGISEVAQALEAALPDAAAAAEIARREELTAQGVPAALAARLAALGDLAAASDIVLIAGRTGRPAADIAPVHFAIDEMFGLRAIIAAARGLVIADHFDRLARHRAIEAIADAHRRLTGEAVAANGPGAVGIEAWATRRAVPLARIREAVSGIVARGLSLSKLMVVAGLLADLREE